MGLMRVIRRKPKEEKKDPNMGKDLYCNGLRDELGAMTVRGWAVCGKPLEMEKTIDYTTLRGGGSNIYHSLVFMIPKWDYVLFKADEWLEVTPEFEYYKLTIDEKQRLQAAIREGLIRAAESVKDYELLAQDADRYREMLDYFIKAKKEKDDHVLKSLFVDRVDAFTGEGFSLVTMARRWPTIISDFVKSDTAWVDPEKVPPGEQISKIRRELDVSASEATVIKTKLELYKEWIKLFLPTLKERYARIKNLAEARERSIEDYRNWLKPYVARYKMMKERMEDKPTEFLQDPYITPAGGMAQAKTYVELWMFKAATPQELGKPEIRPHEKKRHGFMIDPYDDFVKARKAKIEEKYKVKISDSEVEKIMKKHLKKDAIYYWFQQIEIDFNLIKAPPPKGTELDNPVFRVKPWTISQNVLLLHLIELKAREMKFEKELNKLIGVKEIEKKIAKEVDEEFKDAVEKKESLRESMKPRWNSTRIWLNEHFWPYFVRRGPYTPVFQERLTKHFALTISYYFLQVTSFIEKNAGVE